MCAVLYSELNEIRTASSTQTKHKYARMYIQI